MKVDRSGQSQILDGDQLDLLANALPAGPHRMVCLVCRFTTCRVSEALKLRWGFVSDDVILFPAGITKTSKTREVDLHPVLAQALTQWKTEWSDYRLNGRPLHERFNLKPGSLPESDHFLFPGLATGDHMKRQSYDRVLRRTLKGLSIKGASSHSMRRSSLTKMADHGTPLRHIMEISGHQSLDCLSKYLGCTPKQRKAAVNSL